ncbi:MAG: CPBP family intramembrane metalloprotease [Streptococcaceae bacterium]|nr:CPBP family intramembrane metalloprotease [Streptococcaceae bacterium]
MIDFQILKYFSFSSYDVIVFSLIVFFAFIRRYRGFSLILLVWQIPIQLLSFFTKINWQGKHLRTFPLWQTILLIVTYGTFIFIACKIIQKHKLINLTSVKTFSGKLIGLVLLGLMLFLISSLVSEIISSIIMGRTIQTANESYNSMIFKTVPLFLRFIIPISAGFFEELVFRVGLFEILFPKNKKIAFCFSAFIFTFIHVSVGSLTDMNAWLSYGLASLILTAFYYRWRSFYLNMSVHMGWNLVVTLINILL